MDPLAIRKKFGEDFLASERTFRMGIDWRFTTHFGDRFAGGTVLETCTGGGFTTMALARKARHVYTVEIDPGIQAQARENVERAGLSQKVTFLSGSAMDPDLLRQVGSVDGAFLDPDWAVQSPDHHFRFRDSNTEPPADDLLDRALSLTPRVALVLPPLVDPEEFVDLPAHERQHLFLGDSHELLCLYFGDLAVSVGPTELRIEE